MTAPTVPPGALVRVVGDVHGDAPAFAHAVATDRFVVQLGDLTDEGTDSAEALRLALRLLDEQRGLFLLGNHDRKLARALAGHDVRIGSGLAGTLAQLEPDLRERALAAITRAPVWLGWQRAFFVHGAFDPAMLHTPPPLGLARTSRLISFALFGQVTGRMQPDGFPERVLDWVDRIPAGLTVYCGHDRRSRDGRPWIRQGAAGGTAVFLDTGAGKGGHLSWIDL